MVCYFICLRIWFYKSCTPNANLLWLWESPMLVRCNAESHSYRGNRSSSSELVSVSQTCSLFPACPTLTPHPPPLRQQLHAHAHPFTPLLIWNPLTLLGLLSTPEAMRSSGQHISQNGCHPAPPVSLPPLPLLCLSSLISLAPLPVPS